VLFAPSPPKSPSPWLKPQGTAGIAKAARSRVTPFVAPLFLLVAMVGFTYGTQTVQPSSMPMSLNMGAVALRGPIGGVRRRRAFLSAVVNGRSPAARRLTLVVVSATVLAYASQSCTPGAGLAALLATGSVVPASSAVN
jgi:hypothetical protein